VGTLASSSTAPLPTQRTPLPSTPDAKAERAAQDIADLQAGVATKLGVPAPVAKALATLQQKVIVKSAEGIVSGTKKVASAIGSWF
jgi:hypothetical protein